jgi:glutathione S-transferase
VGVSKETDPVITLYAAGAQFGLPELSPFVTKTEVQLKMAGLAYRKLQAMPASSPKGQLPFIDDDGEVVADSTFIRAHIERKYEVDLDIGLDARERAQAWAIERMIENHFGGAVAYTRFLIPENFAKGPACWFDQAPEARRAELRADLQRRVSEALRIAGIGRHSPEEIVELGDHSLSALSLLMGDKSYLMGDRPCGLDATAFGAIAGILTPYFESQLRRRAERYANLVAYVDRMMQRYFPEHSWRAQAA